MTLRSRVLCLGVSALIFAGILLAVRLVVGYTSPAAIGSVFSTAAAAVGASGLILILVWAATKILPGRAPVDTGRGLEIASLTVKIASWVLLGSIIVFVAGAVIPWLLQGQWYPPGDIGRVVLHVICYFIALIASGALFCGMILSALDRRAVR